ncbi:putative glycosidase [Escovopsis weberi]|uniref:Putative glycosidase n=1 Tax=Escovopsis weberi TaxID=150374 RepID=A0A0M8MSF2_ESCWE|nr:putative glycosidase [Escovopsis weberi]
MSSPAILSLAFAAVLASAFNPGVQDLTKYVHTDVSLVKIGPDVYSGSDAYFGYQENGNFTGFSLLHESGTGGAPKYGVVSQMPVVGTLPNPLSDAVNDTRSAPDVTEVGYYRAHLGSGTVLEMAASTKAGMFQYTFPESRGERNVVVDVSHNAPGFHSYTGFGSFDNGWNRAAPWTVYFCGLFDAPSTFKTFIGKDFTSSDLVDFSNIASRESRSARLGAVFTFTQHSVASRVGVSFISEAQACKKLDDEIPHGTTVQQLQQETRDAWNSQVLSKVTTHETNVTKLTQLYSALYFMHLLPTNKTGENPLWDSGEPYYDDIFTFWDTHRCLTPLLHILQPTYYEELLRSMIDIFRHEGYTSDARSSFSNGAVQGGSNSDNVFADAFVKGVRGNVDWHGAYASMVKNAEVVPENKNDPRDPTGSTKEGRSALPDWHRFGFITPSFGRSVSRSVEYAVNDFSLATVAAGLGKLIEAVVYFERSHKWRNQWNFDMQALGFSGFLGPRNASGFIDQDPMTCGGCYWGDLYYEATPFEYSFNANHNVNTLIRFSGGARSFLDRLDTLFRPGVVGGNGQFGNTIFNPGNEPNFHAPYLYHFLNRQDLSVERSRSIAKSYFRPTPGGLPGNSDAGAMESWLLWSMLGLYPVTGQTTFLFVSPWFSDLTISLGGRKTLRITTRGGSEDAFHVQVVINWVSWYDVFAEGGSIEFVLGRAPRQWATGAPPPSPGSLDFGLFGAFAQSNFSRVEAVSSPNPSFDIESFNSTALDNPSSNVVSLKAAFDKDTSLDSVSLKE